MKLLALLSLMLVLSTANPGLQASLNLADVNQILMIAYAFGLTSATFDLGDYSLSYPSVFGVLSANLTDINITSISVDYSSSVFTFQSPNFITYNIYDLEVFGTFGYTFALGSFVLTPGVGNLTLSNTNVTANITVIAVNEQPQLVINSFNLEIGTVEVGTELPVEFDQIINQMVQAEIANIQPLLPGFLSQYVPLINQELATFNLKIAVPDTDLEIDLGLVSDPEVLGDEILVIGLDGTVYQNGAPIQAGSPASIPAQGDVTEGVQFGVTDFVVNSLLTPLWPFLNYSVTTLPAFLGGELTTDTVGQFIPEILQTFGGGLPVLLQFTSGGPISYSTNGNINVQVHVNVGILVKTGIFNWTPSATFAVKTTAVVAADVKNNYANATIETLTLNSIKVANSWIGTIAIESLEPLLWLAIKIYLPKVNAQLQNLVRARIGHSSPRGVRVIHPD